MTFVDIDSLSSAEFQALDTRLKELKTEDKTPPVQVDPRGVAFIEVDGLNYPLEDMLEREALEKAAKIKLMRGKLLLKAVNDPKMSKSALIVIKDSETAPRRGRVVGVGPATMLKKKVISSPVEMGDLIIYMGGRHQEVKVDGEKYIVIPFEDVLVKLKA